MEETSATEAGPVVKALKSSNEDAGTSDIAVVAPVGNLDKIHEMELLLEKRKKEIEELKRMKVLQAALDELDEEKMIGTES